MVYPASDPGLTIVPPDGVIVESGYPEFDLKDENGDIWRTVYRVENPPDPEIIVKDSHTIDGPLYFAGYSCDRNVIEPGGIMVLTTYWKVQDITGRPLSLLAQLVTHIWGMEMETGLRMGRFR